MSKEQLIYLVYHEANNGIKVIIGAYQDYNQANLECVTNKFKIEKVNWFPRKRLPKANQPKPWSNPEKTV
jgi:hypothetical protein